MSVAGAEAPSPLVLTLLLSPPNLRAATRLPFALTPTTGSQRRFPNQPLFREGIQVSGRTAAPFPPASLSGEGLEGGVAAVPVLRLVCVTLPIWTWHLRRSSPRFAKL